jgi:hypothetical protein
MGSQRKSNLYIAFERSASRRVEEAQSTNLGGRRAMLRVTEEEHDLNVRHDCITEPGTEN